MLLAGDEDLVAPRFVLRKQAPTLPPNGHNITAYALQLLGRWRNTITGG